MVSPQRAALAYAQSAAHRNPRQQEADVFHRVNAALRLSRRGSKRDRVRAVADNEQLWITVLGLVRDPANRLPAPLCASIVSIGLAVQQEMRRPSPDFEFLVAINDTIAAGLEANGR